MRGSSSGIRSLTDRLNLLVRRFSLLSVFFILFIFIVFGAATYHEKMNSIKQESTLWASHLENFAVLTKQPLEGPKLPPMHGSTKENFI